MRPNVAIARCDNYEQENIHGAISKCFELLGKNIIPRGKRVLLKPNLLSGTRTPEQAVNTHSSVIEALVVILKKEYDCSVCIGDSSGGMSYGQTKHAFSISGLNDVSKRTGAELLNFEIGGSVKLRNEKNKVQKEFSVTKFIQDVDFVISVPKLKTHSLLGYTGAIKNMMGVVPGSGKRDMHITAPKPQKMAECIVDLFSLVKPNLSVMDAVVGMEGDGPAAGNPRKIGLIIASIDSVALDAVALKIIDYDLSIVTYVRDAGARGLGTCDTKEMTILGEPLEKVKIKDFKKPVNKARDYITKFIPEFILRTGMRGMTSGLPVINQPFCKKCNICYDNCPVKTIEKLPDGRLVINHADCIECYCCHELCPHNSIGIKLPLSARIAQGGVSLIRKILNK